MRYLLILLVLVSCGKKTSNEQKKQEKINKQLIQELSGDWTDPLENFWGDTGLSFKFFTPFCDESPQFYYCDVYYMSDERCDGQYFFEDFKKEGDKFLFTLTSLEETAYTPVNCIKEGKQECSMNLAGDKLVLTCGDRSYKYEQKKEIKY